MNTHNICCHREIRKKVFFSVENVPYLEYKICSYIHIIMMVTVPGARNANFGAEKRQKNITKLYITNL